MSREAHVRICGSRRVRFPPATRLVESRVYDSEGRFGEGLHRRRLYLVRHGETEYFADPHVLHRPETPLTARGREQAAAAAEALGTVQFDRVITSGTRRSTETAVIITRDNPSHFMISPDLREIDSGRLDVLSAEAIERTFSTFMRGVGSDEETLFGGETIGELLARVYLACERLRRDSTWSTAIAVLHGVVNRAVLSWAILGPRQRIFLGGIEQGPACINVIELGNDDALVRTVNYCPWDPLSFDSGASTMEELRARYSPGPSSEA